MNITDLGLTYELSEYVKSEISPEFTVGRVNTGKPRRIASE